MAKEIVAIIIAIAGIIIVTSLITILILVVSRILFPTPKVLNGSTNPTTQGSDGDFYINSTTNTLFGPKGSVTSDVWPSSGISLIGPDGVAGNTVLNGTVDPTTEGVDGDFYLNTTTSELFGPKGSVTPDVWPTPGTSLIGPAGPAGAAGPTSQKLWYNFSQLVPNETFNTTDFTAANEYHIPNTTGPNDYPSQGTTGSVTTFFEIDDSTLPNKYPGFKINTAGKYKVDIQSVASLNSAGTVSNCEFVIRKSTALADDTVIPGGEIIYSSYMNMTTDKTRIVLNSVFADLAVNDYISFHVANRDDTTGVIFTSINTELTFIE